MITKLYFCMTKHFVFETNSLVGLTNWSYKISLGRETKYLL